MSAYIAAYSSHLERIVSPDPWGKDYLQVWCGCLTPKSPRADFFQSFILRSSPISICLWNAGKSRSEDLGQMELWSIEGLQQIMVVFEQPSQQALPTEEGPASAFSLFGGSWPGVLRPQEVHLWAWGIHQFSEKASSLYTSVYVHSFGERVYGFL